MGRQDVFTFSCRWRVIEGEAAALSTAERGSRLLAGPCAALQSHGSLFDRSAVVFLSHTSPLRTADQECPTLLSCFLFPASSLLL